MKRATRGRSYREFDLAQMSLAQLKEHIRTCGDKELSCVGNNKGRRYWKQHKNDAQSELDERLQAQEAIGETA